jgi:ParB-like chromosome segregation protein Spo0J
MSKKIKLDPRNFNKHTEDGMILLENSIREVGVIESISIDNNGDIITGNARFQTFEKLGYKPKIIKLEENEYPVIQTNLEGEKKVKAAIFANTISQKNINLDLNLIQEVAVEEFNIDLEELGIEVVEEKELRKKTMETVPYVRTHILMSFPPEKLIEIQDFIDKIKSFPFVEYDQSSN